MMNIVFRIRRSWLYILSSCSSCRTITLFSGSMMGPPILKYALSRSCRSTLCICCIRWTIVSLKELSNCW